MILNGCAGHKHIQFLSIKVEIYAKKGKNVQDAHEAIRPSYVDKTPESIKQYLTPEQFKLYKLIWETLFINKEAFDKYYVLFARSYSKGLFLDSNELTNQDYETISYMLIGISNFLGIKLITKKGEISDSEIDEMIETASYILKNGLFK